MVYLTCWKSYIYLLLRKGISYTAPWARNHLPSGKRLYPLVNCPIAMENHHFYLMGKSTISMAIFNSYVKLPKGIHKTMEYGKIHPLSSWVNPLFRLGHGFNSELLTSPEGREAILPWQVL